MTIKTNFDLIIVQYPETANLPVYDDDESAWDESDSEYESMADLDESDSSSVSSFLEEFEMDLMGEGKRHMREMPVRRQLELEILLDQFEAEAKAFDKQDRRLVQSQLEDDDSLVLARSRGVRRLNDARNAESPLTLKSKHSQVGMDMKSEQDICMLAPLEDEDEEFFIPLAPISPSKPSKSLRKTMNRSQSLA